MTLSIGIKSDGDLSTLISVPASISFIDSMVVIAIQLLVSLTITRQSIGLGMGVMADQISSGLEPLNTAPLVWLFLAGVSSAANPFLTTVASDGYARMTLVANP